MLRRLLLAAAFLVWLASGALAAGTALITLSTSAYTDLGAAPVQLQANGGTVWVVVADSLPAFPAVGMTIQPALQPIVINAADAGSHAWAVALGGFAQVTVAPVYSSGGGGGGGGAITAASGSYAAGAFSAGSAVDGWDLNAGTTTDAAAAAGGTGTISAKLRRLSAQLPAALGQTTMSASQAVVIASDQSAIPVSQATASNLNAQVVGNAASGAADSGNPVKVACVYNASALPTPAQGNRVDCQADANGAIRVLAAGARPAAGDATANNVIQLYNSASSSQTAPLEVAPLAFNGSTWDRLRLAGSTLGLLVENGPYLSGRVTADGQIKGSAGFVHTISIAAITATPTAGLLTVYNSLTETGTVLYSEWVFATDVGHTITLDVPCGTGIFVGFDATLANVQASVSYR